MMLLRGYVDIYVCLVFTLSIEIARVINSVFITDIFFSGPASFVATESTGLLFPCVLSHAEVELDAFFYSDDFGNCFSFHRDIPCISPILASTLI